MLESKSRVDPVSRTKYARLLRSLATGRITNFEYEDEVNRSLDFSKDPVIGAIYRYAWFLYDDLHKHKLCGEYALTKEARREIAKWLLFLYTDWEYRWPSFTQRLSSWVFKRTGGMIGKPLTNEVGEAALWPFFSREEFNATTRRPVDFRGRANLVPGNETRTRLSRLLPYPVLWKTGLTLFFISIWIFLKWRSFHFEWSQLPAIIGCGAITWMIMSLHASKKFSDLKWWQAIIIFLSILLTVPAILLIFKYFTN